MKMYKVQVFNEVVEVKASRVSVAVCRALDKIRQLPAQPSGEFKITVIPQGKLVRVWHVVANVPDTTSGGWSRKRFGKYNTMKEAASALKVIQQDHPDWAWLRVDWEYVR